jgi:hypothetical protein
VAGLTYFVSFSSRGWSRANNFVSGFPWGPDSAGDAKTTKNPKAKTSSKAKAAGASDATAKDGAARAKASAHPGAM